MRVPSIAVLDANVLYPAPLRDLLLRVAMEGLFVPRWTDEIQDEWIRNLLANRRDLKARNLARTRSLMESAFPDSRVTGYSSILPTLTLPDRDDRHVLAAAIRSGADSIVTWNRSDFPSRYVSKFEIEIATPDRFLAELFDADSDTFCRAARKQRDGLRNPPVTPTQLIETFVSQGLHDVADRLRGEINRV